MYKSQGLFYVGGSTAGHGIVRLPSLAAADRRVRFQVVEQEPGEEPLPRGTVLIILLFVLTLQLQGIKGNLYMQ